MRILVCGGRDFTDKEYLFTQLDNFSKNNIVDCIIEGNAKGADRLAGYWARYNHIHNIKFNADWNKYNKAAGAIRNKQMLDEGKPDIILAFPGGKGTNHMIDLAISYGITVLKFNGV